MASRWRPVIQAVRARVRRVLCLSVQNFPMILFSMIEVSNRQPHTLSVSASTSWVSVGSFWVTHPVALGEGRKKHPADCAASPLPQQPAPQQKLQSTFLIVSSYRETLFQFLVASRCTQVGVLFQQTQTITAVRGREREGGRGKIARGAAQSE